MAFEENHVDGVEFYQKVIGPLDFSADVLASNVRNVLCGQKLIF